MVKGDTYSGFINLIKHKQITKFIKIAPIISLLITNFIVLFIFSYFFSLKTNSVFFWVLFLIGFLFSLITIRTNYVLFLKKSNILFWKNNKKDRNKGNKKTRAPKVPEIGLLSSLILLIRNMFFNILNDSFILIIIWIFIFSLFYILHLIKLPTNFSFQRFAISITLIGVLSGFFQFYIKNYKELVSMKIANSISKYLINVVKKISLNDFLNSLDDKNKEKIHKIISKKEELKTYLKGFKHRTFTFIDFPFSLSDTSFFDTFDYLVKTEEIKDIKWTDLNGLYKNYFGNKFNEFKKEIDEKDLIGIRKLLFSNLIFFDEVVADLEKITFEFVQEENKDPKGFKERYERFTSNCVYYMLDILLNFRTNKENENQTTNSKSRRI
jgi:prepilin signal peptidase PulO-like enzyme (type II secretory pathway)